MSAKNDPDFELDLDAILAEFSRLEEQSAREKTAAPPPAGEKDPAPAPAPAAERPAPAPVREKSPAPAAEKSEPVPAEKKEKPSPRRRKGAAGLGLMLLVLLLLAGALWGLLRWTARVERENLPPEPEPLRLELGAALESYLDEASVNSLG